MTVNFSTSLDEMAGRGDCQVYSLFGVKLATDFRLMTRLVAASGKPDIVFACAGTAPVRDGWDGIRPCFTSPYRTDTGESLLYLYRLDDCDVLRFTGIADFYLRRERITCHLPDRAQEGVVEICLLGQVLSFWLEREGIPALHASSVVVDGRSVLFLSASGNGKSSLAAAFMQAGYPLLTDDILPVEERDGRFLGRSGYPQMRLWPDEARRFVGECEHLESLHPDYPKLRVPIGAGGFGTFWDSVSPLACIYVPERGDEDREIEITTISPRDAVIELLRHGFSAQLIETIGLQRQRLGFFARLARTVPMRRIAYPSGFQHLPRVRDAILGDLHALNQPGQNDAL